MSGGKTRGFDDGGERIPAPPPPRQPTAAVAAAAAANPPDDEPEEGEANVESSKTGIIVNLDDDKCVRLKFREPPDARIPSTQWHLYVFRRRRRVPTGGTVVSDSSARDGEGTETPEGGGGGDAGDGGDGGGGGGGRWGLLETFNISRRSAYLFGLDLNVADIPVSHPSLSDQHAVIQYRAVPPQGADEETEPSSTSTSSSSSPNHPHTHHEVACRPYLMDLGSESGTYLNGVRLEEDRYYELRRGDMVTLGESSREYVLLTEDTSTGMGSS